MLKKATHILLLFIFIILTNNSAFCADKRLILLYRDDIPLHKNISDKTREYAKTKYDLTVKSYPVNIGKEEVKDFIKLHSNNGFFIAIGDLALESLIDSGLSTSGYYLLVTDKKLADKANITKNWQGMAINVPYNLQFEIITKIIPNISCVGTIYTEALTSVYEEFVEAARKFNINVKATRISFTKDVVPAINNHFQECSVFWMLPDPELINDITLRTMTLLQHQLKKPLIGVGTKSVAMGALMSINYDINTLPEILVDSAYHYISTGNHPGEHCCKKAVTIFYHSKTAKMLNIKVDSLEKYNLNDIGK